MRDAGLVEDAVHRAEPFPQIKALGGELCVQDRFAASARACAFDQKAQNLSADSPLSKFAQNGHPADLHFAGAMFEHPAASDCDAVENRECVKCVRVVGVHFDLFGNVLFFDKNPAADRPRAIHIGGRFDRDHLDA